MVSMLVVDDEIYALKGITQGIDWSGMPIGSILEAEDVSQALRLLETHSVDLVISDIEMPGMNGLELLRWIREHRPQTLTVFFTGHARFDYAQEALHQGCFDYILKPVDHDELKTIVKRAIAEIEVRKERETFETMLEANRKMWSEQLPILVERFWQELLAGRIGLVPDRLNRQLANYGIPLQAGSRVLPVLLSIEQWNAELDTRDESIMEYALRKAAAETILDDWPGTVLQDRNELNLVLLYLGEGEADRDELLRRCREYVQACAGYFHCRVSCYVGEAAIVGGLSGAVDRLQQLERSNVSVSQSVIDTLTDGQGSAGGGTGFQLPSFPDWGMMLESGGYEELVDRIEHSLTDSANRELLALFQYGILHMLYQAAFRKGISIYEVFTVQELKDAPWPQNPHQLSAWAGKLVRKMGRTLAERQRDTSVIIAKVRDYIAERLHEELTRDEIAHSVYRNPAYLSRLFRKETGSSLSDYIAQLRIERAKRYLIETNDKVSNIAEDVGYAHFSYFAKLFKKMTGLSPQEYRKKHQKLP